LDPPVILGHADMGMGHGAMNHGTMDHDGGAHGSSARSEGNTASSSDAKGHANHAGQPSAGGTAAAGDLAGKAGYGSNAPVTHQPSEQGFQVDMQAETARDQLHDPGIGLRGNGRRVLTYAELKGLEPTIDKREPEREIQLHLTGNMTRYMWSMDGIRFSDADPLALKLGERIRITLINDTMMNHPIHLHGMWSELETGDPQYIPRKHTITVQPGSRVSYLVTPDMSGDWAYHCHLLYHMMGMFRRVRVA